MFFSPAVPYVVPTTMIDVINHLGLQSGLKLCLDAGDAASYTSGQTWLDRSGGGYDFNRGSGSGSDGADPTFNGVAGRQSSAEYWSFDGGDYFSYDSAPESWMSNIHKNNGKFSIAGWVYCASFTGSPVIASSYSASNPGFSFVIRASNQCTRITVFNASSTIYQGNGTTVVSGSAWTFVAVSVDETAGTGTLQVQATQESLTPTYSSPSAAAAAALKLGAEGDGTFPLASGNRMASMAMWEGVALSAADLLAIYNSTKSKYGL